MRDDTVLAEERDSNRAVLGATADGLVLLAPDDTVTYVNPAALTMLRMTERKLLGKKIDVEALLQIKRLLHSERFTIEGARKRLKSLQKEERRQPELPLGDRTYRTVLSQLRKELESLHRLLT